MSRSFFAPANPTSLNVPQYRDTIETVELNTTTTSGGGETVDCTDIVAEYNLLKTELTDLKNLFSLNETTIAEVLAGLSG